MTGTWLNAATVLVGGSIGLVLGARFPRRMQETVVASLGLFTLAMGVTGSTVTGNPLVVLGSLLVGALIGEAAAIEARLDALGGWLERRLSRGGAPGRFVEGFVTASLVFCVGPLTIQGALEDGLTGDYTKLAVKAMLDGFAALAFAASLGPGVLASVLVVVGFQGGISLLAARGAGVFTAPMIAELTATGGILLMAIGLRLLRLTEIRAANLLPALLVAPVAVALLTALGVRVYPSP